MRFATSAPLPFLAFGRVGEGASTASVGGSAPRLWRNRRLPGRFQTGDQIVQRSFLRKLDDDFLVRVWERIAHRCVKVATCLPVKCRGQDLNCTKILKCSVNLKRQFSVLRSWDKETVQLQKI